MEKLLAFWVATPVGSGDVWWALISLQLYAHLKYSVFEKCWKPRKAFAQLVQLICHDTKIKATCGNNIKDFSRRHVCVSFPILLCVAWSCAYVNISQDVWESWNVTALSETHWGSWEVKRKMWEESTIVLWNSISLTHRPLSIIVHYVV